MKVLLLNLAGPHETATDNTVIGVRQKYTSRDTWWSKLMYGASEVLRVDLHDAYREAYGDLETKDLGVAPPKLSQIKAKIDEFLRSGNADKVMLSIHGEVDDVDHGVCRYDPSEKIKVPYRNLADFFMRLVGDRYSQKPLKLTLVMCYGARSSDYTRSHAAEDLVKPSAPDLTTSYAFKFYVQLCEHLDVVMTARTGALSFDKKTGASLVESEEYVRNKLALRALQLNATKDDPTIYESLYEEGEHIVDLIDRIHQGQQEALHWNIDELGKIGKEQKRVMKMRQLQSLLEFTKERESKGKYGKIVFERSGRSVLIKVRYDSDTRKIDQPIASADLS